MNKPQGWTDQHEGTWDRIKDAMKRDWEQTKNDVSKKSGKDLDQSAGDTVKQVAGKEAIPGPKTPNDKWDDVEQGYRFGAGSRGQFEKEYPTRNDKLDPSFFAARSNTKRMPLLTRGRGAGAGVWSAMRSQGTIARK